MTSSPVNCPQNLSIVHVHILGGAATCSKGFCNMFSKSYPCLLGQNGSCSTAQQPGDISENSLQNLRNKCPPHPVGHLPPFPLLSPFFVNVIYGGPKERITLRRRLEWQMWNVLCLNVSKFCWEERRGFVLSLTGTKDHTQAEVLSWDWTTWQEVFVDFYPRICTHFN